LIARNNPKDLALLEKKIKEYAKFPQVVDTRVGMAKARKWVINQVTTQFLLTLDVDTDLPEGYLEDALRILEFNPKVACVVIDYEKSQGHYAFGTGVWRTSIVQKLYDYSEVTTQLCECSHLYHKVLVSGYTIESLYCRAVHNKESV
jgi:hypothetical protein